MNTSAVAKLLGVSPSTIQRWVRQLGLQMERNELGHYLFKEGDIELLKQVQDQLSKGIILQDVTVHEGKTRKGTLKTIVSIDDNVTEKLLEKIEMLEKKLNGKADDVVSYQLLQHRREIEELQAEVKSLTERIEKLESKQNGSKKELPADNLLVFDTEKPVQKIKKKNILTSLFGF
ncbi:MerR family transcriptional regulator [Cytobacillus depressus]|uniref:Chromosome-anchoring protein RacA n=1 Tax=Cytobacillus depressus TaxID=1602942 RepID=A0A6L3V5N4_9BACI|nr:MerR family transcriptional regulator [Cytobacillus depressus]KAB2334719.1 MerR family transcriptional regulator [Cytobacillus depressus]